MSDRLPTPRDINIAEGTFGDDRSDPSLNDYGREASRDRHVAAKRNSRIKRIGGGLATGAVIAIAALSGLDKSPKNTTENALSPGDIPALTIPDGHISTTEPQQIYDGVHTSDGVADDVGLPTSPEDKAFGQKLAEQNEQAQQRVAETYEQATGGATYAENTGGTEAQVHP